MRERRADDRCPRAASPTRRDRVPRSRLARAGVDGRLELRRSASVFSREQESVCVSNPDVGNKDNLWNLLMNFYKSVIKHINHGEAVETNCCLSLARLLRRVVIDLPLQRFPRRPRVHLPGC